MLVQSKSSNEGDPKGAAPRDMREADAQMQRPSLLAQGGRE
jgi:hypothetical protein